MLRYRELIVRIILDSWVMAGERNGIVMSRISLYQFVIMINLHISVYQSMMISARMTMSGGPDVLVNSLGQLSALLTKVVPYRAEFGLRHSINGI